LRQLKVFGHVLSHKNRSNAKITSTDLIFDFKWVLWFLLANFIIETSYILN